MRGDAHRTALPWIAGAAAAQLALVAASSPAGGARGVAVCALVLALPLAAALAGVRGARWWHLMAVVGAIGGLGMIAGAMIDARAAGVPVCHTGDGIATWANALMLATCVPACVWLSPDCRARRSWRGHAACTVGMLAGMAIGGRWLAPAVGAMVTGPATHHIAMVIGMMLGAAGASRVTHEVTLDPPRPTALSAPRGRRADRAAVPARAGAQLRGARDA